MKTRKPGTIGEQAGGSVLVAYLGGGVWTGRCACGRERSGRVAEFRRQARCSSCPNRWRSFEELGRWPVFSDEDADLRGSKWRADGERYAVAARGRLVRAHRVVAERMNGGPIQPGLVVDHINGDGLDNRRENLRIVTRSGNCQNVRGTKAASGYRGVTFDKRRGKWLAWCGYQNRLINIGRFDSAEAANEAAKAKRAELGFLTGAAP